MPFRSEKQRRFLWAEHPDIAKRWAHEYPQKKKLPMYADDKDKTKMNRASDVKAACDKYMAQIKLTTGQNIDVNPVLTRLYGKLSKQADSTTVKVTMPQGTKPMAAGEEPVEPAKTQQDPDSGCVTPKKPENMMLSKLSVVLSQSLMQALENEKAEAEARNAQLMPANAGIKRYAMPANGTPPPMGMAQSAAPAAPAAQPAPAADPAQSGQLPPVGGGSNPSANPINSYGAISSSGEINGNAAFGGPSIGKLAAALWQRSLNEKLSAAGLWANIHAKKKRGGKPAKPGSKDYPDAKSWEKVTAISEKKSGAKPCSCGCGDTVTTCKCAATCACRKAGGSCYKEEKTAASSPAWQRAAGKNEEGGLNAKGRASYNKATGGNLKAPVTESNPTGERDKRQNSFCARMCGMKKVNTGAETKKDPDSRINKSLRKWNCKCSSAAKFGAELAQYIDI
jgi:hypothetical protein